MVKDTLNPAGYPVAAPRVPGQGLRQTGRTLVVTRALLAAGVIAGPLYIAVGLVQMLIRPGFDIRRHELSLMSNGDLGWIQIGNFVVTGLLSIACALGVRRVLRGSRGGLPPSGSEHGARTPRQSECSSSPPSSESRPGRIKKASK